MNQLAEWIARIVGAWKFWVIVAPWEVGIRVRLGRKAIAQAPGPHWRVPFLDAVTIVNTRLRVTTTPPTTLQDPDDDSRAITRKAVVAYRISGPLRALQNYDQPEIAVCGYAQAQLAAGVDGEKMERAMVVEFKDTGIEVEYVRLVENVRSPVFRLLQDSWTISSGHREQGKSGVY